MPVLKMRAVKKAAKQHGPDIVATGVLLKTGDPVTAWKAKKATKKLIELAPEVNKVVKKF